MKVKVFYQDGGEEIEADVNEFIEGKEIVDIKFTSTFSEETEEVLCSALIMYKED